MKRLVTDISPKLTWLGPVNAPASAEPEALGGVAVSAVQLKGLPVIVHGPRSWSATPFPLNIRPV